MSKIDDIVPDGPAPQVHFASLAEACAPVTAWLESRFGVPVNHNGTFKYLDVTAFGVTVRAWLYGETETVEWGVGFASRMKAVGCTKFGVDLDVMVPPAVLLASAHVDLQRKHTF